MEIDNGYYIDSWNYQATIHANNVWDVTETLTVTYLEPRHGIYHYLTRSYTDWHDWEGEANQAYSYRLEIEDIEVEGAPFTLQDESDALKSLNIVIGDADRTITGQQTYVISYRMQYRDDRCEEYDQLFHSVMASNVTTQVGDFRFHLQFDKELPQSLQEPGGLNIYSGDYGFNKNDLDLQCQVTDHSISGHCQPVPAYHAITLFSRLPEGYYESPLSESAWCSNFSMGITLVLLLYLLFDLIFQRHVRKAVPVVTFYPPKGLTSAEVGTIIDDSADTPDLISLLPWLAQEGYIRITEIPDDKGRTGKHADLELELLRQLPSERPKYMHTFMEALFGKKLNQRRVRISALDEKCGEKFLKAKEQLGKTFTGEQELTSLSGRAFLLFLAYLTGAFALATSSQVETFGLENMVQAFLYLLAAGLSGFILLGDATSRHLHGVLHKILIQGCVLLIFAFGWLLSLLFWEGPDTFLSCEMISLLYGFTALTTLFSGRYMQDTPYRMEMMGQLLGLREFIRVAELPKLKMLVDEDPTYFYKVLPYAMVFGLTDKWSKQFADIDMVKPDWYHATSTAAFSSSVLTSQLNSSLSSISSQITAQSQASAASSGSSGGFAGGGGGGGGTGSW